MDMIILINMPWIFPLIWSIINDALYFNFS